MPRPCKQRNICCKPDVKYFKPRGITVDKLDEINLTYDELESVRLADLEKMHHENAAIKMNVSRQTFGNVLISAHEKIAKALVKGKALKIGGGKIKVMNERC